MLYFGPDFSNPKNSSKHKLRKYVFFFRCKPQQWIVGLHGCSPPGAPMYQGWALNFKATFFPFFWPSSRSSPLPTRTRSRALFNSPDFTIHPPLHSEYTSHFLRLLVLEFLEEAAQVCFFLFEFCDHFSVSVCLWYLFFTINVTLIGLPFIVSFLQCWEKLNTFSITWLEDQGLCSTEVCIMLFVPSCPCPYHFHLIKQNRTAYP